MKRKNLFLGVFLGISAKWVLEIILNLYLTIASSFFSRNNCVVFRNFCAWNGITVEESIHEFSENYEYNHGDPEVGCPRSGHLAIKSREIE